MRSSRARQRRIDREGPAAASMALLAILMAPRAFSHCGQQVAMTSYSVCVPAGLRVERHEASDTVVVCDAAKRCATYFGAPPRGLTFLFVRPAEGVYGHAHYSGAREVVAAAPHAGRPAPQIAEMELGPSPSGLQRKCFMTRRLLPWASAWDEEYGLEVDHHLFSVWTRYEDDPKKIEQYRVAIREILSSISPK